jgi:hypothetical protein
MNCKSVQRQLLGLQDPGRPDTEVQAHLDACPSCSAWQRRLTRIEHHVPLLPVPPSTRLPAFQRRLLRRSSTLPLPRPPRVTVARLAVAGLAAAVLLAVVGVWVTYGPTLNPSASVAQGAPTPDPLLASLMQRNLELARAVDTRQSIEGLRQMASDLHGAAPPLAGAGDEVSLEKLASWYDKVVREGIVGHARRSTFDPVQHRAFVEETAHRLTLESNEAERLAKEVGDRPDVAINLHAPKSVAHSLGVMAKAARDGSRELRGLIAAKDGKAPAPPADSRPPTTGRAPDRRAGDGLERVLLGSITAAPLALISDLKPAAPVISPEEQARRFRRNRALFQSLVHSGLRIAAEEPGLHRARQCNKMAARLSDEIKLALDNRDAHRAAELGLHFRAALKRGVADTLAYASKDFRPGSTGEQEMRQIGAESLDLASKLQDELRQAAEKPGMRTTAEQLARAVSDGRAEVERVIGAGNPPRQRG